MEKNNSPEKTNPYADSDGGPLKGEENLFFQYAEKEWSKYLETLSPEEREQAEKAISNMAKKMDS